MFAHRFMTSLAASLAVWLALGCEVIDPLPDFTEPLSIVSPGPGIYVGRGDLEVFWEPAYGFFDYAIVYREGQQQAIEKPIDSRLRGTQGSFSIKTAGAYSWTVVGIHNLGELTSLEPETDESGQEIGPPIPKFFRPVLALDLDIVGPPTNFETCSSSAVDGIALGYNTNTFGRPDVASLPFTLEVDTAPFPETEPLSQPSSSSWRIENHNTGQLMTGQGGGPLPIETMLYWRLVYDDNTPLPYYSSDSPGNGNRKLIIKPGAAMPPLINPPAQTECGGSVELRWPGIEDEVFIVDVDFSDGGSVEPIQPPSFDKTLYQYALIIDFDDDTEDTTATISVTKCGSSPRYATILIAECD